MILCNIIYVCLCKIGEKMRLLVVVFMVRAIQPGRLASALCLWLPQRIHWTTLSVLVDSMGKRSLLILSFPVLLQEAYEGQCGILLSWFCCEPTQGTFSEPFGSALL